MVGAGWIAQQHRRVLDSMAGARLAAVCDIDPERAGILAAGTGARTYLDWRDLLDREDLGALIVCTPPRSHREPAVAALSHGLPVYLEKPIARTPEDAAEIVAAAEDTRTVCAVGYQWHARWTTSAPTSSPATRGWQQTQPWPPGRSRPTSTSCRPARGSCLTNARSRPTW